jgi:membrane protein DedA with SNARE-associated domain
MAGIADISVTRFTVAILIGRGTRYLLEGLLALWFGERALSFIRDHGTSSALAALGLLAIGFVVYLLWQRRQRRK